MKTQGIGLSIRDQHISSIVEDTTQHQWGEVLIDNYFASTHAEIKRLHALRSILELSFHSVGMNLASVDPVDPNYLHRLAQLVHEFQPFAVSDHLSWTAINGVQHHDLLPFPYTNEALDVLKRNIGVVQSTIDRNILIENPSRYLSFEQADYSETEFINTLCKQTGCSILLDINNVYVTCTNAGLDPLQYLEEIDPSYVEQFHLGGHEVQGTCLVDTHSARVSDSVWRLYEIAVQKFGSHPTVIEWDRDIPEYEVMKSEMNIARDIQATKGRAL